jgi:cytochrome bd-type quinol oxidase subunit 1
LALAKRSFEVATGFGLASILSVIVLGDESGYVTGQVQKVKMAAMEAEWETEPPPSHFTLFGFPSQDSEDLIGSIIGMVLIYTIFLVVEVYLMVKFIRRVPSSSRTGRYHFEQTIPAESIPAEFGA